MAKRKITVCDGCGNEVTDNEGGRMRLTYTDPKKGAKEADLCGACATDLAGHPAKRRGRPAKTAA